MTRFQTMVLLSFVGVAPQYDTIPNDGAASTSNDSDKKK
jgi:hypothetical protein